jgi:hypothetical protein
LHCNIIGYGFTDNFWARHVYQLYQKGSIEANMILKFLLLTIIMVALSAVFIRFWKVDTGEDAPFIEK